MLEKMEMPGRKRWIAVALVVFVLAMLVVQRQLPSREAVPLTAEETVWEQEEMQAQPELVVHVAGAVANAGVYTLQQGQRVEDAIQQAGLLPEADADLLNRAQLLTDGQRIVVPYKQEPGLAQTAVETADGLISINSADREALMALPGIGAVRAQAILDYRADHGLFQSIEELQQVHGIGSAVYGQIRDKIKL